MQMLPLRHLGMLAFQCPSRVHANNRGPEREYPAIQLKLYSEPCIQPVPFKWPFAMDEGSLGHSKIIEKRGFLV